MPMIDVKLRKFSCNELPLLLTACLSRFLDLRINAYMHFVSFDKRDKHIRLCLAGVDSRLDCIPSWLVFHLALCCYIFVELT